MSNNDPKLSNKDQMKGFIIEILTENINLLSEKVTMAKNNLDEIRERLNAAQLEYIEINKRLEEAQSNLSDIEEGTLEQ